MKPEAHGKTNWFGTWLDAVKDGRSSMRQRSRTMVEAHGGIEEMQRAAETRAVHLVELTDDKGRKLIAASKHPFTTIC